MDIKTAFTETVQEMPYCEMLLAGCAFYFLQTGAKLPHFNFSSGEICGAKPLPLQ